VATENTSKGKSVVVTSWYDNKKVMMISNFVGKEPVGKCTNYDKKRNGQFSTLSASMLSMSGSRKMTRKWKEHKVI
jgi:antitoxin component YwqK of YwqJK toxin-antitoxin module